MYAIRPAQRQAGGTTKTSADMTMSIEVFCGLTDELGICEPLNEVAPERASCPASPKLFGFPCYQASIATAVRVRERR